jgi:hypothetical protein
VRCQTFKKGDNSIEHAFAGDGAYPLTGGTRIDVPVARRDASGSSVGKPDSWSIA